MTASHQDKARNVRTTLGLSLVVLAFVVVFLYFQPWNIGQPNFKPVSDRAQGTAFWLWGAGILLLGVVIAYGILRGRGRSRPQRPPGRES